MNIAYIIGVIVGVAVGLVLTFCSSDILGQIKKSSLNMTNGRN